MLQPDHLAYYFSLSHELPEIEFKGPGKGRENPLFGRVVRAAMAMANRRGGGTIIIGVSEVADSLSFTGLNPEQLMTWKYESIADGFNSYTSSPIEFDTQRYEHDSKTFLILDIHEFATVPVMCIKEYRDQSNPKMPKDKCNLILQPYMFYVRTINKPESREVRTSEEVRALVQLAIDKGIQSFVTLTRLANINIAPLPDDTDLFAQQLKDWTGPMLDEIRTRGYWSIDIRPVTFRRERVPLSQLYELISRASVSYWGWQFPSTSRTPLSGSDWIGLEVQAQNDLQVWRLFQSGQFAAEAGLRYDWGDRLTYHSLGNVGYDKLVSTVEVVYRLTEFFELASHLATTGLYGDEQAVVVEIVLCNVLNRRLFDRGTSGIIPLGGYVTSAENIPYSVTLAKEDVIGRTRELALEAAKYFFERFSGWEPSTQLLTAMQSQLPE